MENIVYNFSIRSSSVEGIIKFHFNKRIPDGVFGWNSELPKRYLFVFIVPNEDIEDTRQQCAKLELRNFIIVGTKGMITGG